MKCELLMLKNCCGFCLWGLCLCWWSFVMCGLLRKFFKYFTFATGSCLLFILHIIILIINDLKNMLLHFKAMWRWRCGYWHDLCNWNFNVFALLKEKILFADYMQNCKTNVDITNICNHRLRITLPDALLFI